MEMTPQNFSDALKAQLEQATGDASTTLEAQVQTQVPPEQPVKPVVSHEVAKIDTPAAPDPRVEKIIAQAQQVRAEREAMKREQDQHKADMAELAQLRELKARAKEDPVAWAEAAGYKPDEYATTLVEKGAFTPERKRLIQQEKELQELKSWRGQVERQQEEQKQAYTYQQTVNALKNFANQEGDRFDLVKRTGNYNLVIEKFHEHYQRTQALGAPEELPWEMAFEQAENEILTKYDPVLESPKIRSRYGAAPAPQSASSPAPAARPSGSINPRNRGTTTPPREMNEVEGLEAAGKYLFRQFGVK